MDERNFWELTKLHTGSTISYEAVDFIQSDGHVFNSDILCNPPTPYITDYEFNSFQADRLLHLKRDAQVILLRNLSVSQNLVNGTKGIVVGFADNVYDACLGRYATLPIIKFLNGSTHIIGFADFTSPFKSDEVSLVRKQIPLKLGWAMTVHRSQGMTLERVDIDLERAFAPGHAYVAFSRVKSLNGLNLKSFGRESVIRNQKVSLFYQKMESAAGLKLQVNL